MVARGTTREPLRTCVGCRRVRPKQELVRIVATAGGSVAIDRAGREPGRGAYLCPDPACARRARGRIGKALRAPGIDAAGIEELMGAG